MKLLSRFSLALLLTCLAPAAWAESGFRFDEKAGESLDVLRDGKIVARYMLGYDMSKPERRLETYKPYLHVFDAEGKAPITKGAGGSFPHHRGIYIGWNKLTVGGKTYDRWHMKGGEQIHVKFLKQEAGAEQAVFTSQVRWTGEKAEDTLIEEERTFTFLPAKEPGYVIIDTVSKLKAVAGETVLDGDVEHAGLHFRPSMDVDLEGTSYLYPKEKADAHKDRGYPWFGETITIKGQKFSIVYLNHPGNPPNAQVSAYRDYGRFGAFWKDTIPAGGTKEIRARFLVSTGELPTPDAIQKAYNAYAGTSDPTPKTTAKPAEKSKPAAPKATPDPKAAPKPSAAATPQPSATPAPKPTSAAPETTATPATADASTPPIKKRAGGGPENPVINFPQPVPPVLTAAEALKTFKLVPGFKIECVASEPLVEAPIALSWDDQGRAYVVEMIGYMQDMDGAGEDQPNGRIKRLEDTDGDGIFDKATIFVDKLVMPRAVVAVGDGALVSEPPYLRYYRDTNGDGVADSNIEVSDKYATAGGQPEHMANSLTYMQDNWIGSSGHGFRYRFQNGQFLTEATNGFGQWGRTQDDWGRPYFNYNSDLLRVDLVPPAYYARNPRLADKTAINYQTIKDQTCWPSHPTPGVNRGYIENTTKPDGTLAKGTLRPDGTLQNVTATCGATIYRGNLFAREFQGNAFVPEPSGNLVKRLVLSEKDGVVSAANAYQNREFLTSTDERFRPVNAYTGPDGALYLVDMSRGILQHKAFLTYYLAKNIEDRKLTEPFHLGRIYRIVPDGAKPKTVKLPKDSAQIVPLLGHANGVIRDSAQRVLVERADASVVPAVKELAAKGKTPQARVHALWTLEGLSAVTPDVVTAALKDSNEKVRITGIRLADPTLTPELLKLVKDPSSDVRLHLAFNLSGRPGPEIQPALLALLSSSPNPTTTEAIASGLAGHELEFIEAYLQHTAKEDPKTGTDLLRVLSNCVLNERRASRISRLLALAAEQPADSPRQIAILTGLAGKAPAKGKPAGNPIKLDTEPPALAKLLQNKKAKPLAERVDSQLVWVGKPGANVVATVPLTPAEQAMFEKGKAFYATICIACHQPNGAGMAGLAPTLAGSEWVMGPSDRLIRIVLQGLTGPIEVAGTKFQGEMPGLPALTDEDVAGVLTYIRRDWDNTASAVTVEAVAKVREAIKDRTKPWTAEELKKPFDLKTASKK